MIKIDRASQKKLARDIYFREKALAGGAERTKKINEKLMLALKQVNKPLYVEHPIEKKRRANPFAPSETSYNPYCV